MEALYRIVDNRGKLQILIPLAGGDPILQFRGDGCEMVVPLREVRLAGNILYLSPISRLFGVKLTGEELRFLQEWKRKATAE